MTEIPSLLEMIKAGVHFGHRTSKWHPKMEPYIYTTKKMVYLLDLEKTQEKLKFVLKFARDLAEKDKVILFVGTRKTIKDLTKKYAEEAKMPYINERWLGGTLTNFSTISQLIKKLKDLESQKEKGELAKYTKREQLKISKKIEKLSEMIGGIKNITKLPDAIFLLDTKDEKTAVEEAKKMKIVTFGIVDTNCNPESVTYPIPANDDSIKSVEMITGLVAKAIEEGRKK